jgi:hypothetical protein
MPSYRANRAIVRAREASQAIHKKFDRFLIIAGKEKVKSRFFREYKAYQDFEKRVGELEKQAKAGKARVGREVAEDITRMEFFEEKQLLKDHAEVHEDISNLTSPLDQSFR